MDDGCVGCGCVTIIILGIIALSGTPLIWLIIGIIIGAMLFNRK